MWSSLLHRLRNAIVDIIYPRFSELDAITILYVLVITSIEHYKELWLALRQVYTAEQFSLSFYFTLSALFVLSSAYQIIKLARTTRTPNRAVKAEVATFFYFSITLLTIVSYFASTNWLEIQPTTVTSKILLIVQTVSLFRAIAGFAFLKSAMKNSSESVLATRFHNYQATRSDLAIVGLAVPFFYWINYGYDPASVVLVSYFYAVVLATTIRDLGEI